MAEAPGRRTIEDELTHRILDAYHDERPDPDPNRCSFERIADVLLKLTEDEYRALGERAFGKSAIDLHVEDIAGAEPAAPQPPLDLRQSARSADMLSDDDGSPILTISQLCRRWHCTRNTINQAVHRGELEVFRVGKRCWRIRLEEVERYERTALKIRPTEAA